jgi:hypothetical protein
MLQNQNTILPIFDIRNSSNQQIDAVIISSTYKCIQTWLGNNLEPQEWGWILQNDILENRQQHHYHQHQKNCAIGYFPSKKGCGSSCGCRNLGLQCSSVYGQCNGQACLNASPYPDDLKEESEYARI